MIISKSKKINHKNINKKTTKTKTTKTKTRKTRKTKTRKTKRSYKQYKKGGFKKQDPVLESLQSLQLPNSRKEFLELLEKLNNEILELILEGEIEELNILLEHQDEEKKKILKEYVNNKILDTDSDLKLDEKSKLIAKIINMEKTRRTPDISPSEKLLEIKTKLDNKIEEQTNYLNIYKIMYLQ